MRIFCAACGEDVDAQMVTGDVIYPHRPDLHALPFWMCPTCRNFVGCHHKTSEPTRPLGCIPSPELRALRKQIHAKLDPIWAGSRLRRRALYQRISDRLGREYHTADTRSTEEARRVLAILESMT
jgi:hypothetical protein